MEEIDDLEWARELAKNTPNLPVPDGKTTYVIHFAEVPTIDKVEELITSLFKFGWHKNEKQYTKNDYQTIVNYRTGNAETYIYLDKDTSIRFGSKMNTFIRANSQRSYDTSIKLTL